MYNQNVLISDEISPLNLALVLLIKLYISHQLPIRRSVLFLLVRHIEGGSLHHNKLDKVTHNLIDFCEEIRVNYSDGVATRFSEGSKNESNSVNCVIFMLLDLAWGLENEEQMHRLINDAYALILDSDIITYDATFSVSQRSIIGRFVQKIVIAAKLLHFEESIILYQTFCLFRESSLHIYQSLRDEGFKLIVHANSNLEMKSEPIHQTWYHKVKDDFPNKAKQTRISNDSMVIRSLQDQLDLCLSTSRDHINGTIVSSITKFDLEVLIDAQVNLLEKFGTPTPPDMKSIMEQMARYEFLNASNSHVSPYQSYHYLRYLENLYEGNYLNAFDSLHQYFDYMVSQGSKYFYHFALIARASLHQCFGEDQRALDSIEEAISVARENKDNGTLTYVLSWLFNFMKDKPNLWAYQSSFQNNSELQLLEFLSRKSNTVSLLLAAVSFCFITESLISKGDSPAKILQSLFKALYVSINDGPASFVKCCELASLVWDKLGVPHLTDLYVDIGLSFALEFGSKDDALSLKLRSQVIGFLRDGPERAIDELKEMQHHYSGNIFHYQKLQRKILLLQTEASLRSGNVLLARENLKFFMHSGKADDEARFHFIRLHSKVLAASNDYSGAIQLVSREISDVKPCLNLNLFYSIKLNLIKTCLLILCGAGTRAFSLLVQQMKLAKSIGFGILLNEALLQLVSLLNETGNKCEAYQFALRLVPTVSMTRDQHLIATIHFELARSCCAFLMGDLEQKFMLRKEVFANFLRFLSISIAGYKKSFDLNMLGHCFELERRVAHAVTSFSDEMAESVPFQNFKEHSKVGLEVLQRKASAECNNGYLKS